MNTLHLPSYIAYGGLLKNIAEQESYDVVIMEQLPEAKVLKGLPKTLHVVEMKHRGFAAAGEILAYYEQYEKVLIILDTMPFLYCMPLFHSIEGNKKCTIINVGAGVSGLINKQFADVFDVGYAALRDVRTVEPYDVVHFFSLLNHAGIQYIRVPMQEYVTTLFGEENVIAEKGVLDLTAHGLSGDGKTVLSCASKLSDAVVHAQQMIDDEMPYDLFGFVDYNFKLTNALQSSLRQTESLLLYVDAHERTIVPYVKSLLFDAGLFETNLEIISPDASAVTTNQEERVFEQAGMVLKV